jgi:hypothetical protein
VISAATPSSGITLFKGPLWNGGAPTVMHTNRLLDAGPSVPGRTRAAPFDQALGSPFRLLRSS